MLLDEINIKGNIINPDIIEINKIVFRNGNISKRLGIGVMIWEKMSVK